MATLTPPTLSAKVTLSPKLALALRLAQNTTTQSSATPVQPSLALPNVPLENLPLLAPEKPFSTNSNQQTTGWNP